MKILMLLFKDIHYDARVKREALALAQAGHQVLLACLEEYKETPPVIHENILLMRIQVSTKRLRRNIVEKKHSNNIKKLIFRIIRSPILKLIKDTLANYEFYQNIKGEMERVSFIPDVVHCHDLNTLPVGCFLAKQCNAKIVYDSHELFNEMAGKNKIERKIGYLVEGWLIKKVDHLIVVNPLVEKEFRRMYGDIRSTIIQNIPIYRKTVELKDSLNYWREKYNLQDNDRILIFQGGLNPERGLEKCIDAVTLLPMRYKLVLLGEGRIKEDLKKKVKKLNINNRVFFHHQVPSEELLWYTKHADIGLVMYENTCKNNYLSTPNKIFEYIQAGIPIVSSNHPGKSYFINTYKTGVCVEETPNAIKEGILQVEKQYKEIQAACLKARENLKWVRERDKLIYLYEQLGENL